MSKLVSLLLSILAILLSLSLGVYYLTLDYSAISEKATDSKPLLSKSYQPRLEYDPPVPDVPASATGDFKSFLKRLREVSKSEVDSLILHDTALDRAEQVFRSSVGVPKAVQLELHRPFYTTDPEAIFALYSDLPTLERGLGLFQQHCSQCHGAYGRGNGSATLQWYGGNLPRNFWYAKYKNRSTEYGTVPTDADIYRTLTRGLYGSSMPSFRHLSPLDRWSLVEFVKSLANFYDDYDEMVVNRFDKEGEDEEVAEFEIGKEPKVSLETVTRGRIVFIEQGCVKCHQGDKPKPVGLTRAEGGFTNWLDEMNRPIEHSRDLTNRVFRSGAASTDLFRIISGGPTIGPMPSYLNVPRKDRWALVHYVQSVFKPDFPQAPPSADKSANPPKAVEGKSNSETSALDS